MKKIVIIGVGLIGGSIGKAFLDGKISDEVVGICRRQESLERAIKEKALTGGYVNDYRSAVKGADMVFIATPVCMIKKALDAIGDIAESRDLVVTDAGSTKKEIVDYAARFKEKFSFIGGHPLAGSEKKGVENSSAGLFKDTICVLTRADYTNEEALRKVSALWRSLGAVVDILAPEEHDRILSFTSHMPHVAAYILAGMQKKGHGRYISSGFRDTTRIASSNPGIWSDIFISNKENMLEAIDHFKKNLQDVENDIRLGNREGLKDKLSLCKKRKDEIS